MTARIFYDTEFIEDGRTIELISIGLVAAQPDGRFVASYYAVNAEMPTERIEKHDWLVRNVVPHLPIRNAHMVLKRNAHPVNAYPKPGFSVDLDVTDSHVKPRQVIANEVRDFIHAHGPAELWADYSAYDHVVLAQLYGQMVQLPAGIPMFTHDLRQEITRLGVDDDDLPAREVDTVEHNALSDALHNLAVWNWLHELDGQRQTTGGSGPDPR